ncbi:MAG: PAS domain S-box protein [Verrucomicrobiota bacterium]|jgi:PAS domain S-box-containing protein
MSAIENRVLGPKVRLPAWPLGGALVLTASFCVWLAWGELRACRCIIAAQQRCVRFAELRGVILHLDEVLTMSARMAAATGDRAWEERYRRFEPELDAAIKAARRMQTDEAIARGLSQTDTANLESAEPEHRALALARQGRLDEARAVLSSREYEDLERAVSDGVSGSMGLLASQVAAAHQSQFEWRRLRLSLLGGLAGLGLSFWTCGAVIQRLRRGRCALSQTLAERSRAVEALREDQKQLEARVQQRTAALSAEVLERQRAERAEQALRESEAKYRALFDESPDGILIADIETKTFKYANPALCRMLGYTEDELRTMGVADIHPKDALQSVVAEFEAQARGDKTLATDIPCLRKDGSVLHADINSARITVDDRPCNVGFFRDTTERKRATKALQESEARYRALFNESAGGILIADIETKTFTYANPALCRMLGYTEDELRTMGVADIHPKDALQSAVADFEARVRGEKTLLTDIPCLRKDGSVLHADINTFRITVDDRPCNVGLFHDITERKRAEESLRRSEERFRALFERVADALIVLEPEGRFVDANQAACESLGYTREELLHLSLSDFEVAVPPTVRSAVTARVARGEKVTVEGLHRRKDGTTFPVEVRLNLLECGGHRHVLAAARDITERKRAEESLRLLGSAVEQSAESIVITEAGLDPLDSKILFVNPAFTKMRGYTAAEVLGKTPWFLLGPGSDQKTLGRLLPNLARGEVFRGEVSAYRKDGTPLEMEWVIAPIRHSNGAVTHFVASQRDITQRKRAEAELKPLQRQLLDAARQAGMAEVATSVLHNVGNVLSSVNVSGSLMADKLRNSKAPNLAKAAALLQAHAGNLPGFFADHPKAKQLPDYLSNLAARLVKEQTEMLEELAALRDNIEHIKDIVALQQGYARISEVPELQPLAELIEHALRINAAGMERHQVHVIRQYARVPEVVAVERQGVLQILVNLISNAKYALEGAAPLEKRLVLRTEALGNDRVKVSVIDNGIGIPAENLTRIFELGFTTRKQGHGFGLHNGALAATRMGGALSVHSDGPGKGATFVLELPCQPMAGTP